MTFAWLDDDGTLIPIEKTPLSETKEAPIWYAVTPFRCVKCGYVELYHVEPPDIPSQDTNPDG